MEQGKIINSLRSLRLFNCLPDKAIEDMAVVMVSQTLDGDEYLFRQGNEGNSLFVVEEGELRIFFENPNPSEDDILLATAGPGHIIGEISLLDKEPRAASAAAVVPTVVRKLHREDFFHIIEKQPPEVIAEIRDTSKQMRLDYLVVTLEKLDIFEGIPTEALKDLAGHLKAHNLQKGQALFDKGDVGEELFIIKSGWVKIFVHDSRGDEFLLNQCGPGEAIGEMALIDQAPRSASVQAITDVYLLVLDRSDFFSALSSYPEALIDMMRSTVGRLRLATTMIEQLGEWSRGLAEGNYEAVLDQIKEEQSQIVEGRSMEDRVVRFLSTFFSSIEAIKEREEKLRSEVLRLKIQIDETKREEEFSAITSTDFFNELTENLQKMREELREDTEDDD